MKTFAIALYALIHLGACYAEEPKIIITERPEWQKPVLEKVVFGAETKDVNELLGKKADQANKSWKGFVIFSCTAKENLGKRLLWINAEVEFSNGSKRKFESICFGISKKGTEYDIVKIPFETTDPVSVKTVTITLVAIK